MSSVEQRISRRQLFLGVIGIGAGYVLAKSTDFSFLKENKPEPKSITISVIPPKEPISLPEGEGEMTIGEFIGQFELLTKRGAEVVTTKRAPETFKDGSSLEEFIWFVDENHNSITLKKERLASTIGPNGTEKYDPPKLLYVVDIEKRGPKDYFENVTDLQSTYSLYYLEGQTPTISTRDITVNPKDQINLEGFSSKEPSPHDLWVLGKKLTDSLNWAVAHETVA